MRSYESLLREAGGGLCNMQDIRYRLERLIDLARKDGADHERDACLDCYSPDDTAHDWADKIRERNGK